jgi:ABC-type nitrate/sulfonate/bicarbonate transport system substrate-binding protein
LLVHDIDREHVTFIDMKPDEMSEAIHTGKVDAVSTWNPTLKQVLKESGNNGIAFYGESFYTEFFCLASGQDYVLKHPEAVRKALRALIRAEAFVKQQPEEARRLVADFIQMDKAALDEIWDIFTFRVTLDQALLVDLEDQTRWVIKNGLTARKDMPDYLDFIYVDGLRSVKPDAVRIIR